MLREEKGPHTHIQHEQVQLSLYHYEGGRNVERHIPCWLDSGLGFCREKEIKKAIENYIPSNNRSEIIETKLNKIILDAYNANPTSMKAAIENFENTSSQKNKIAILGDMFELGDYSEKEHQEIVNLLNENSSIKKIYLTGNHFYKSIAKDQHFSKFKTTENLLDELKKEKITESYILIKGSRGMALEQATQYL